MSFLKNIFSKVSSEDVYGLLLIDNLVCTRCECEVSKLKKCDGCHIRTLCKECSKKGEHFCHECNSEYERWAKKLEKLGEQAKNEKAAKKNKHSVLSDFETMDLY